MNVVTPMMSSIRIPWRAVWLWGRQLLRKLEFLIGEALDQGCDTFITAGARQSNHARLSAAAAAPAELSCELVLTDIVARDDEAYRRNGNVLLDDLFGATVLRRPGDVDALAVAQARAEQLPPTDATPMSSALAALHRSAALGTLCVRRRS